MVYYLGHYSCEEIAEEKRTASPPAMNKMRYIISVLSETFDGETVVVSPCETSLARYVRGGIHPLNGRVSLKTFDSFGIRGRSAGVCHPARSGPDSSHRERPPRSRRQKSPTSPI